MVVRCGVVWCGVVWCGVVWCGVVRCGAVRCGAGLVFGASPAGRPAAVSSRRLRSEKSVCLCLGGSLGDEAPRLRFSQTHVRERFSPSFCVWKLFGPPPTISPTPPRAHFFSVCKRLPVLFRPPRPPSPSVGAFLVATSFPGATQNSCWTRHGTKQNQTKRNETKQNNAGSQGALARHQPDPDQLRGLQRRGRAHLAERAPGG